MWRTGGTVVRSNNVVARKHSNLPKESAVSFNFRRPTFLFSNFGYNHFPITTNYNLFHHTPSYFKVKRPTGKMTPKEVISRRAASNKDDENDDDEYNEDEFDEDDEYEDDEPKKKRTPPPPPSNNNKNSKSKKNTTTTTEQKIVKPKKQNADVDFLEELLREAKESPLSLEDVSVLPTIPGPTQNRSPRYQKATSEYSPHPEVDISQRKKNEGESKKSEEDENEGEEDENEEDERFHPQVDVGIEFRSYPSISEIEGMEDDDDGDIHFRGNNNDDDDIVAGSKKKKKNRYLLNEDENNNNNAENSNAGNTSRNNTANATTPKQKFPHYSRDYTKCRGCGIRLQSEREGELGYVPPPNRKKSRRIKRICQRCYYLRYYNGEPPSSSPSTIPKVLQLHSATSQLLNATVNQSVTNNNDDHHNNNDVDVLKNDDDNANLKVGREGENGGVEGDATTATTYVRPKRMIAPDIQSYQSAVAKDVVDYLHEILPSRKCVVVHLIDLSDISPESILQNVNKIVGTNPVFYIGTKFDLLPEGATIQRVREWLRSYLETVLGTEISMTYVHVVAAICGQNVKNTIMEIDELRRGRDIFVVGCVNSGKSTFINSSLLHLGIGGVKYDKRFGITTSWLPGTTLDAITLPLKSGGYLHDTPGLQVHSAIPTLTKPELLLVLPRIKIKPKIINIRQGKSLYLGGMGRLDYVRGPPVFLAVFVARTLRIHIADCVDAPTSQMKYVGKSLVPPILTLSKETPKEDYRSIGDQLFELLNRNRKRPLPPYYSSRIILPAAEIRRLQTEPNQPIVPPLLEMMRSPPISQLSSSSSQNHHHHPSDKSWITKRHSRTTMLTVWSENRRTWGSEDDAMGDIVFPGVGWISITGAPQHPMEFEAFSMHPTAAYFRSPSLMPYDATVTSRREKGVYRYRDLPSISIPYIKIPNIRNPKPDVDDNGNNVDGNDVTNGGSGEEMDNDLIEEQTADEAKARRRIRNMKIKDKKYKAYPKKHYK